MKPGYTHGDTDEYGIKAVDGRMHTNDLHATLLALLGLVRSFMQRLPWYQWVQA